MEYLPKFGKLPETHLVPDVLEPGLKLVFCGTALGQQSAMHKAYYANPSNLFWKTVYEVGFTPRRFKPEEYEEMRALGIGLTDLCKTAFGNDDELPENAFDRDALEEKIIRYQPRILAFTSKTGAANYLRMQTGKLEYGFQSQKTENTAIYVLPSPSGHARRFWRQDAWQALADKYNAME